MAFFSKLKERLFKSSSKLEEGLDAIVEDGGEEEAAAPEPSEPSEPRERPDAPPEDPQPDLPEPSEAPPEMSETDGEERGATAERPEAVAEGDAGAGDESGVSAADEGETERPAPGASAEDIARLKRMFGGDLQ